MNYNTSTGAALGGPSKQVIQAVTTGHPEQPKTATQPQVDRAMEEMHRHVAMLRESVQMLVGRLGPVSSGMAIKESCGQATPSSCFVEGQIRSASVALSEIHQLVAEARESLCI